MKFWVNTLVWGRQYIDNFLSYALPSLMAPGNLPALTKYIDAEYAIHTESEDVERIQTSLAFERLRRLVPTVIYPIDGLDTPHAACALQSVARIPIVNTIRRWQGAVMFCSPDEIWADGSFDYIGRMLAAGKTAIMTPGIRVTTETFIEELSIGSDGAISIDPLTLQKHLLKHMHPHVGASYFAGPRCPAHPEYIAWPVADEGVIFYHLIRSPDSPGVYVPHLVELNSQGMLAHGNDVSKFELAPANRVLCASLTSINWMVNWLHDGKPHTALDHARFLYWYHSLDWDLMKPVRIQASDKFTPDLWEREEQVAQKYFDNVRKFRDELLAGKRTAGDRPHSPSSCGVSLSKEDIKISRNVLEWIQPVISGRFKQATIDFLDAKSAGDEW